MISNLSVNICGFELKNPLILASGFLGTQAELMQRVAKSGAAGVTNKSCNLQGRAGYENPTVLAWEQGIINAVGLTNPGIDKETEELKKFNRMKKKETCLIASIFGATIKEICQGAEKISKAKPNFIELNVSCPHVDPKVKGQFYNDKKAIFLLVKSVKKVTSVPLIVKLSANTEHIVKVAKAAELAGASAISAINTLGPGMLIDIETGKAVLSNKFGGLSGPAVFPIALKCVYQIYQAVKIPIIGMGGVTYGKEAIAMIMAGATAVGVGSAIYYRGINVFNKINSEIRDFLLSHKIKSVSEIRGISHEN